MNKTPPKRILDVDHQGAAVEVFFHLRHAGFTQKVMHNLCLILDARRAFQAPARFNGDRLRLEQP